MTSYSREEKVKFVEELKRRTKQVALDSILLSKKIPKSEEEKVITRQFMRSATLVSANYRAACRGRARTEYFSKLSITVEEADEVLYWIKILEESGIMKIDLADYKKKVTEILLFWPRQEVTQDD